jgi:hypothetical protein
MRQKPICPNGRQHINLSQYAYDIVRNDALTFLGTLNISGFINKIIENTKDDSFDDIALIEEERIITELSYSSKSLKAYKLKQSEAEIIKKIAAAHRIYEMNTYMRYVLNCLVYFSPGLSE